MLSRTALVIASALAVVVSAVSSAQPVNLAGYNTSDPYLLGPSNANCVRQFYEITATANNTIFTNSPNATEAQIFADLQLFSASLVWGEKNFTDAYISGYKKQTYTYQISGTYCTPKHGIVNPGVVQLLVHGLGFDSNYWHFGGTNSGVPTDYSYVEWATAAGYDTFRFDMLGTGLSFHPTDALNIVQISTHMAMLEQVALKLQSGEIGGKKGVKIIAVGHSYGSIQLNGLTQSNPKLFEGIVLTGFTFSPNIQFVTSSAYSSVTTVAPSRWPTNIMMPTYLMTLSLQTNQLNFMKYPSYMDAAADYARSTEQPITQGMLFTFGFVSAPAPEYEGFVYAVTGANDWGFCTADCYGGGKDGKSLPELVGTGYPKSKNFDFYIPDSTGHAISVHMSAPETYSQIQKHLARVL